MQGWTTAEAVGRFAMVLGRFHELIPRVLDVFDRVILQEVVGLDTAGEAEAYGV